MVVGFYHEERHQVVLYVPMKNYILQGVSMLRGGSYSLKISKAVAGIPWRMAVSHLYFSKRVPYYLGT